MEVAARVRVLAPALVVGGFAAGLVVLNRVDPNEPGNYPLCPFLALTGWYCPGCGTLRMLHHISDGDVAAGFWMNPLGFGMLLVLTAYWGQWTYRVATGSARGAPLNSAVVWGFLVVVVAYTVLRNVAGLEWLAPG